VAVCVKSGSSWLRQCVRTYLFRVWLSARPPKLIERSSQSRPLTPPSSGRPKAGFAIFVLPLMSNVRPLMKHSATKGSRRIFVVLGAAAVVTASFLAAYVAIRTPLRVESGLTKWSNERVPVPLPT